MIKDYKMVRSNNNYYRIFKDSEQIDDLMRYKEHYKKLENMKYMTVEEFKERYIRPLYRKEKGLLGKRNNVSFEHINSSNREFFAESFKRYILNKEEFYSECPLTKDFLDEVFSK